MAVFWESFLLFADLKETKYGSSKPRHKWVGGIEGKEIEEVIIELDVEKAGVIGLQFMYDDAYIFSYDSKTGHANIYAGTVYEDKHRVQLKVGKNRFVLKGPRGFFRQRGKLTAIRFSPGGRPIYKNVKVTIKTRSEVRAWTRREFMRIGLSSLAVSGYLGVGDRVAYAAKPIMGDVLKAVRAFVETELKRVYSKNDEADQAAAVREAYAIHPLFGAGMDLITQKTGKFQIPQHQWDWYDSLNLGFFLPFGVYIGQNPVLFFNRWNPQAVSHDAKRCAECL